MTAKSAESHVTCEHNSLIRRQFVKIESLESEVSLLRLERDALQSEVERLHFQLDCLLSSHQTPHERHTTTDERQSDDRHDDTPRPRPLNKLKSSHSQSALSSQSRDYELSQQLIDRRVDALERKYGGLMARAAAVAIQRAFRTYRLQKRFKTIAFQALRQTTATTHRLTTQSDDTTTAERPNATTADDADVFMPSSLVSSHPSAATVSSQQQMECQRKRYYRVGLNLFNKQPSERGIQYLMNQGFIERVQHVDKQAEVIARFLLSRKGVSKAMIGEYLASPRDFNQKVLKSFVEEIDFCGQPIDSALRKFQTYFRFPGEAQKIERLVDAFASRFTQCNAESESGLSRDSAFILSFAIIMLNTDLHAPTNAKNRMTANQWLQNLRGVFKETTPISQDALLDIYHRIKSQELRTGADHVTQVQKVQQALIGQSRGQAVPNLCLESRRLVCYCRLYEVKDKSNKSRDKDRHQREVFLFNDLLLVTKLSPRAANRHARVHQMPEYLFRLQLPLEGLSVLMFQTQKFLNGIDVRRRVDDTVVLSFNARNELDQKRFAEDLRESIAETDEMEALRIAPRASSLLSLESRGLHSGPEVGLDGTQTQRRKSSSGSLDSGLSLPSRDHSPQTTSGQKK